MTDIFMSSDLHFHHQNIQKFCPDSRPKGSVQDMNEMIIYAHNQRVKPHDHWYHLGDFSFGTVDQTLDVLSRMNGQKHFILGNHDQHLTDHKFRGMFTSLSHYKVIKVEGIKVILFHFPQHEWLHCHRGSFCLFGHVHSNYKTVRGKSMNVGIDTRTDLAPYSWEEVKKFMADKPVIEHH
jgi:calcineurin-like phosphoesterase family protein